MDIWNDIKTSFREGSVITRLIYLNLVIFLLFRLIHLVFFLSATSFNGLIWFELPAGITQFLRQPWSLITYMFLHFDFLHILFNLLVLYWFGRIFLEYFTQSQLLGLYLLGGLSGGLFYILAYNIFPVFSHVIENSFLLGASASIIAVLMAAAVRDPNRNIYLFLIGRVPLKFLVLFMVFSYIIGISVSNAGGNLAHLGGVVAGWVFTAAIRKGTDLTAFIPAFEKGMKKWFKSRTKITVIHKNPLRDDYEYNRQKLADHNELNRILEKISHTGYDSLTRSERDTLFRHGN